jgi:hypothetical protein
MTGEVAAMRPSAILFTAAALMVATGCTTTRTIDLDAPAPHVRYELTLDDGRHVTATEMTVTSDSVYWVDTTGRAWKAPAAGVRRTGQAVPADPARFKTLNALGDRLTATVLLTDGSTLKTTHLRVALDAAAFWCADQYRHLATREIREVHFTDHGYGVLQGFGLGMLLGLPAGALSGGVSDGFTSASAILTGAGLGALLGGPLGAAAGGLKGTHVVYRFEPASDGQPTLAVYPVPVFTSGEARPGLALRVTF